MRSLLFLALVALSASSFAQNYVDLAKLFYQQSAPSTFDSSSTNTGISELSFSFTLPIVLSDKTAFITGGSIDKFGVDLVPNGPQTNISSYLFKAGFNINHSNKVSGTYLILPKLASDFEGTMNGSDFQFGAVALLKFQRKENFKYKLGLYYNPDRFGTFFVPLLGLYSKTKKWEVDMTLPVSANANYKLGQSVRLGADFRAVVKSFNLHRNFTTQPNNPGQHLHQSSNEISTYLSYEIKKGFILKGQVGYSIGRSYRIYNNDDKIDFGISAFRFGDDRKQINTDFADGLVFRAEMIYRFYTDD